uniref:Glutathione peroxidase n=1 Tax=Timema cristinae TaxID=61476 RepID=A0A7R9GZS2_TIMCR|nr:unnamed protein product [Timema cristinae]
MTGRLRFESRMVLEALFALLLVATGGQAAVQRVPSVLCNDNSGYESIYNYTLPDLWETQNISLASYTGKVRITRTAFTGHYWGLNALQSAFQDLVVLGFPCNQFGMQEPGANASEISNGIRHVRPGNGFTPNFLLFKKIHVNGDKEQPLFTYLKKQCPPTRNGFAESKNLFYSPLMNNDIRWNFEKFLVNRQGVPVKRYDPSTIPDDIHNDISELTQQSELSFTGK